MNPIWLVKTRMQLQLTESSTNYRGAIHALRSIVAQDGVLGLYKGIVPALLLTSHGAVQFASYEKMKQLCTASQLTMVSCIRATVAHLLLSPYTREEPLATLLLLVSPGLPPLLCHGRRVKGLCCVRDVSISSGQVAAAAALRCQSRPVHWRCRLCQQNLPVRSQSIAITYPSLE